MERNVFDNSREAKAKRLKRLIDDHAISQNEIARRCVIQQGNLSKMLNGKQTITKKTLMKVCKVLNVSLDWLENGVGEMYCCNKNEDNDLVNDHSQKPETEEKGAEFGHLDVKSLMMENDYLKKLLLDKDNEIAFLRSLVKGQN